MALTGNYTTRERAEAARIRAQFQAAQAQKRSFERQVAGTSKNGSGPAFGTKTEPMPPLSRTTVTRS
jgi:hypothetical protein